MKEGIFVFLLSVVATDRRMAAASQHLLPTEVPVIPVIGPLRPDDDVPLSSELSDLLGEHVQRDFRVQAHRMPSLSRRLLLEGAEPSSVAPEALFEDLQLTLDVQQSARNGLASASAVLRVPGTLSAIACARLRAAVDSEHQQRCDTVDGAPDYQLNMSVDRLTELIGSSTVAALWQRGTTKPGQGCYVQLVGERNPTSPCLNTNLSYIHSWHVLPTLFGSFNTNNLPPQKKHADAYWK